MRHKYELSEETIKVLTGNISPVAAEMGVSDNYIYAVLAGTETDRFAAFEHLFISACNVPTARVEIWLDKLTAIYRAKRKAITNQVTTTAAFLQKKLKADAHSSAQLAAAITDGILDESECHAILACLAKNEEVIENLKSLVHARLGEITEQKRAGKVVNFR